MGNELGATSVTLHVASQLMWGRSAIANSDMRACIGHARGPTFRAARVNSLQGQRLGGARAQLGHSLAHMHVLQREREARPLNSQAHAPLGPKLSGAGESPEVLRREA